MNKDRRIYEIEKEFGIPNRVFLKLLRERGIQGKTHTSTIDDDTAKKLVELYNKRKTFPLLQQIVPRNLLSFDPRTKPFTLKRLNILIGPNSAGKSNFLDVIALMRATPNRIDGPGDMRDVIRRGGGVRDWLWKGREKGMDNPIASVDLVMRNPDGSQPLRHVLSFREEMQQLRLDDERIENEGAYKNEQNPDFYYQFRHGEPVMTTLTDTQRKLAYDSINTRGSILAQFNDPERYPELRYLVEGYEQIRIYREWAFGRKSITRSPQPADMRHDRLEEDCSNLGLFLNYLRSIPKAKSAVLEGMRDLYEGVTDFDVSMVGATVQVFLTEGDFAIPATRLSDGTLRYLCLLAILCDPNPPSLICIEEPELGLHPDIIPKLADLLKKASRHTQLIVTTHSDILVDAMTEQPESVVICEKHNGVTEMQRLKGEDLSEWLEGYRQGDTVTLREDKTYRLGELWLMGEIGGTRW